jgi:hypothetical protein
MAAPIETKVKASTAVATAVGVLITVLNTAVGNSQLMGSLPAWLQSLLTLFGPPLVVFLGGFYAPHTPRVTAAPEPPTAGPGVNPAA